MSRLVVTVGARRWEFEPGPVVVIGRDPECAVVVEDPQVSRRHLSLEYDPAGGGWVAADAGSSGGTFLSGEQLTRFAVDRALELRLGSPEHGVLVVVGAGASGLAQTVLPGWQQHGPVTPSGPGYPPPGPGPGYPAPGPRSRPSPTLVLGTALLVAGYLAAALGVLASGFVFSVYDDGPTQAWAALTTLGLALGLGATAVAGGTYLRVESRR